MSDLPKEEQVTPAADRGKKPIKRKNAKPVAVYLLILFAAAFILLLMAYFMQQRSSNQVIGNLQNSVSQFQTVDDLREENRQLQTKVTEYEALLEQLNSLGFLMQNEDGRFSPAEELNLDELLANGISLVQGPCIEPEE